VRAERAARARGRGLAREGAARERGAAGLSGARERRERKERGGKKRKEEKRRRKWKKGKEKEKEGEGEKREFRGEPFGGDHDAGRARAAVASACRGFGGKWRARIEGNRGTEWRLDPGAGTGEKISGVRVQVFRRF